MTPTGAQLVFTILPETYAVCRLEPTAGVPAWAGSGRFTSVTRSAEELSIICPETAVPAEILHAPGWRCLKLEGPFDFAVTGLVASFSTVLARAGISVVVVCTYDTDYLLVQQGDLERAAATLVETGHGVRR